MTVPSTNVDADVFCSAAIARPALWEKLNGVHFRHRTRGKGQIVEVLCGHGNSASMKVRLGKETFTINSNILANGSYQLLLPVTLAGEIGIRMARPTRAKPAKVAPVFTSATFEARQIEKCLICNEPSTRGFTLSDGSYCHSECYEGLNSSANALEAEIDSVRNSKTSIELFLARLFETRSHVQIELLEGKLAHSQHLLGRIWDNWPNYPPDWQQRRRNLLQARGQCEACGSNARLHVHHKVPLSRGGSNSEDNLAVLCEECHSLEHGGRAFQYQESSNDPRIARSISLIREAIDERLAIRFTYKRHGESDQRRTVTPLFVQALAHQLKQGSTLCVVGYCHLRKAERTFAIFKMHRIQVLRGD